MPASVTPSANSAPYELEQVWLAASERLLDWDHSFHELLLDDRVRMRAFRAAIAEVVRPGMTVLDLGCGEGKLLARLIKHKQFARVVGVDVAHTVLERAARRLRLDELPERQRARVDLQEARLAVHAAPDG